MQLAPFAPGDAHEPPATAEALALIRTSRSHVHTAQKYVHRPEFNQGATASPFISNNTGLRLSGSRPSA
eukprot:1550375-Pleurochrysis_carterae.AAC.3